MPRASWRKGPSDRRPKESGLLALALLMPLPRVRVSLPDRKRRKEGAGPETDEGSRLVDWTERKITIFHNFRLLPRVSVVFPVKDPDPREEADLSVLGDEALLKQMMVEEQREGPPEGVDEGTIVEELPKVPAEAISLEEAIRKAMGEDKEAEPLEVAKRIVNADGKRDVALPGAVEPSEGTLPMSEDGTDTISQSSMVLVEGRKGPETRAVTENLCYGLLENGYSVTYISTTLVVKDFIVEMHSHNYRIARYLPEHQLLCIPVYPIIEGTGRTEGLLDKLMSSAQLQTTDVVIVDSLSDFLGGHFDEVICMRLLEYLRHLSSLGKTVFLVVDDGQKGILSLRLASDLHFALPADRGKVVQVKRYHPPKEGARTVLHFRIDPVSGLVSQPRKAEQKDHPDA